MDYSDIKKVVEETKIDRVNDYLATGRWILLSVAPGRNAEGYAYTLYSLGWCGEYDPDNTEAPSTEFPC